MSRRQTSGRVESVVKKSDVVVAVKACKEIPSAALTWALSNVIRPGDCARLLVLIPSHHSGLWHFPHFHFHNDCTAGHWRLMSGTITEQKEYITEQCNQMMSQLHDIYDPEKVMVKVKVVFDSTHGSVASEAKTAQTHWVVLDKHLKKEAQVCTEQLDCNIVVVKNSEPKILRLNLSDPRNSETEAHLFPKLSKKPDTLRFPRTLDNTKVPNVTPTTSPDWPASLSSLDSFTSTTFMAESNWEPRVLTRASNPSYSSRESDFDQTDSDFSSSQIRSSRSTSISYSSPDSRHSLRQIMSLRKGGAHDPPPLCSMCHHKAPSFGNPPKVFSYQELEQATDGFSDGNFLAEGGYGSVHRGVLWDGQVVAIKQHKLASTQGDREFCSEVQILSCAQHRNVVMLIGYCVEDGRRLLVYEFICNGSLDSHLYGRERKPLEWAVRQKIAVGAARGLRYLHEECRVGCIVHRDMRPNNILLTHDFEPLVGDFGLARLQADGDSFEKTRVIGTFGYMAPEYAQTGQLCEKADVYSFGVVLVELVTGRKAVDIRRPKGEQCLTEWARPLLEEDALSEHVDPCLVSCYSEREANNMMHCALLCLQRDPESRPRMSQDVRGRYLNGMRRLEFRVMGNGWVHQIYLSDGPIRVEEEKW